jgi:hypothetical protein
VLVATVIMGAAVVGLLSNLSTSLSNASRLTDYDRARLMAKRTMDEIMVSKQLPKGTPLEGFWDPSITGVEGGWRAMITPFERSPNSGAGQMGLDRYEVEVWWNSSGRRQSFVLEGYQATVLTPEDMQLGVRRP